MNWPPIARRLVWPAGTSILILAACGAPTLPLPPAAATHSTFEKVPYPPPAAFVELVPDAPNSHVVWIDGHWAWRGRRYVWQRGGWVRPPDNAYYAPWQVVYMRDGTLMFAESAWFDAQHRRVRSPEIRVPATTPPNELTAEEQQSAR